MNNNLKEKIFNIIKEPNSSVTHDNIMCKLTSVEKTQGVKKAIKELIKEGNVILSKSGKLISSHSAGKFPAKIVSQSRTFAFSRTIDGEKDIFIPAKNMKTAVLGDKVMLYRVRNSEKGLVGAVERILETGPRRSTGTILYTSYGCELVSDLQFRYNIPIPLVSTMNAKNGDKVEAIIYQSGRKNELYAKVSRIYGRSHSAKICADAVIDANDIPNEFSDECIELSKKISSKEISKADINCRTDLRDQNIFTIDGEDAKDLDDAISIKRTDTGWELGVHIADVSYYICQYTPVEREAFLRGTSVYFADRVIPMLHETISNGVCSLNSGQDKLTFSVIMQIDKSGNLISYKFLKTIINSKVRGVYSEINSILNETANESILKKYGQVIDSILEAKQLSYIIGKLAKARGVIDIYNGESRFKLNEDGVCTDIFPAVHGESENIIENFMIMANHAAANYARESGIPFIYRIHEEPDLEKLRILAKLSGTLGLKANKIRQSIKPLDFCNLLEQAKGLASYRIVSMQVLRTMAKARYDHRPLGHFGLSLKDYTHFTSPIRRYSDMCIHRILGDLIQGKPIDKIIRKYEDFVQTSAKQASMCEIRAMKAEREAEKYYMAEFMSQHIDEEYIGTVSGATTRGVFVELENTVSGFMELSCYKGCRFTFDGLTCHTDILSGKKLSVGDRINIKVVSSNISTGLIDFAPVNPL